VQSDANVDLDAAKADPPPANVVSIDTARNGDSDGEDEAQPAAAATDAADGGSTEEKPWYVPERTTSRRRSID
jgi:hypothetical protein